MTAEKICIVCGFDCADRPRMKDSKGRYACRACVEAKKRPRKEPTPTTPAAPIAIAEDDVPATDGGAGFSMDQFLGGVETPDADSVSYCPNCGGPRAAGAVVCMDCGFNSDTGAAINTKVLKAKTKKERSRPRMSGGAICIMIALVMLVLLPGLAVTSVEGAAFALIVAAIWNLVAYAYMVGAAFRDDDRFWGFLGILFWLPLVGQFCWLAFVLYYCTIGSHRTVRKVNYWAAFFATVIIFGIMAANNPDMFE